MRSSQTVNDAKAVAEPVAGECQNRAAGGWTELTETGVVKRRIGDLAARRISPTDQLSPFSLREGEGRG